MTTTPYTLIDFTEATTRELIKRMATYPRIIAKKEKQGASAEDILGLKLAHARQILNLEKVQHIICQQVETIDQYTAEDLYKELQREIKMRKNYYPRLIYFKRITPEVAERETAVWAALVEWWYQKYVSS